MKDKTKASREYLEHALRSLPGDFNLSDARLHIRRAIEEIVHVEKKAHRRVKQQEETVEQKWRFELNKGLVNPFTAQNSLNLIEQMINAEKAKLKSVAEEAKKETPPEDGHVQNVGTILG